MVSIFEYFRGFIVLDFDESLDEYPYSKRTDLWSMDSDEVL